MHVASSRPASFDFFFGLAVSNIDNIIIIYIHGRLGWVEADACFCWLEPSLHIARCARDASCHYRRTCPASLFNEWID
jgi:hypothetical protein